MSKRPNIIIFNPDEMRADALHHLGNAAAQTPFLDSFAQEAVSFSNAYCQSPVCVPSRCSLFTGLYPHVHGHRTMQYLLREGEKSLFSELMDSDYYVWMNARNDLVSGNTPGLVASHATEIYYGGNARPNPGPKQNLRGKPGEASFYSMYGGELALDAEGRNYNGDEEDVDAAIERIRTAPKDQPLCMFLGLLYPHPPYQVEEPYFSAIDIGLLPRRIRPEDGVLKPRMEELIRRNQGMQSYTEADWDALRATYLGMCMKVDDMFRRLCEGLKAAGEYDNSLIIFVSDHGDYTGDYGISEKSQNTFEDCLVRVPLLIKPPKDCAVDPGVTDSLAELIDVYATVLDYADARSSHTYFGKSLRDIVADRDAQNRSFVCCEGGRLPEETHCNEFLQSTGVSGVETVKGSPYWARHFAQTDNEAHAKGVMLRTKSDKYISRVNGPDEYYDLLTDRDELNNRADDPACKERIRELQVQLMKWLQRTSDVVPFDIDARFTEEMVWAKVKRLVPAGHEEEVLALIRGGMNAFLVREYCSKHFTGVY